jgi:hypothetical protein
MTVVEAGGNARGKDEGGRMKDEKLRVFAVSGEALAAGGWYAV